MPRSLVRDLSRCYTRGGKGQRDLPVNQHCDAHPRTVREARLATPQLDGERLLEDLDSLARFGASADGATERIAYSPVDQEARRWVEDQMGQLGLEIKVDQAGNSICCYPGQSAGLPAVAIGSHTDTVPQGGRYDGALGVVAAMGCMRALHKVGLLLRHPLELINFAAEEATMGGTLGSRAMADLLEPQLLQRPAWDGRPVGDHLTAAGLDPSAVVKAARSKGSLACFLELHIEQGGSLEEAGLPLGIVEGIVGIRRYSVVFQGQANHAGTTPMAKRRDALVMAAPFILKVRDIAMSHGIVGTVGSLRLQPGTPSVIPGWVELSLETRGLDETGLNDAESELSRVAEEMGGDFTLLSRKPPTRSDPRLLACLTSACKELGIPYQVLPSGAGHDAMCIANIAPQAMLFVPSGGGISHSPEEYTDPESCIAGARVLLNALLKVDAVLDDGL